MCEMLMEQGRAVRSGRGGATSTRESVVVRGCV